MGRAEVGTPKYLANKMKSKGLQKLRWFCQMCAKQCRDENGFKCHTMSESHQRQLLLFADNPGKYMHSFSKEFSDGFIELLKRRFNTKRVSANKVYQEYISDKNHLHMNATRWLTLTGFCQWLGKTGICVVDETEKGWFITYIDRSPEVLEQQEKLARKEKADKDDQERMLEFIEKQVERAKKDDNETATIKYSELKRVEGEDEKKITLDLKLSKRKKEDSDIFLKPTIPFGKKRRNSDDDSDHGSSSARKHRPKSEDGNRKMNALDEIMAAEETKKERANRKDYWLHEGVVVKLVTKALGDKFYKQKGVVLEVVDKYAAKLKLLESGEKIKVDQTHVETVIPAVGKQVLVLNGAYRGTKAILKSLNERNFCVTIEIAAGVLKGRLVSGVQYEDISKIHAD